MLRLYAAVTQTASIVHSSRRAAVSRRLLMLAALAAPVIAHAQGRDVPALMEHYGFSICHADAEPKAGPAWIDIAANYRGNAYAASILTTVVRLVVLHPVATQTPPTCSH